MRGSLTALTLICMVGIPVGLLGAQDRTGVWTVAAGTAQDTTNVRELTLPEEHDPSGMLERRAKLSASSVLLKDALEELHEASSVPIVFSPSLLPTVEVTCECLERSIGEALTRVLRDTGLRVRIQGEQIFIVRDSLMGTSIDVPPVPGAPIPPVLSSDLDEHGTELTPPDQQGAGTITGRITDATTGEPVPSVQIFISGLDLGVLSQQNGRYLLQDVPAGTHTVSVERLGYRSLTTEVAVGSGETVVENFRLSEEALQLDEVVVTGTPGGTQRRALGNSVGQVELGDVSAQVATPSVEAALTGRVPGLQFTHRTGVVGTGTPIQIRGVSSFNLSANPLIYVDGVRVNNSASAGPRMSSGSLGTADEQGSGKVNVLNDFNTEDIESIEVIKGPAAATLYGTEASAGVIQIITKRGAAGEPQFDFSVRQGTNFMMDPAGKAGTYFICSTSAAPPCPEEDLISYNMYEESAKYIAGDVLTSTGDPLFSWPSDNVFQYGHNQLYNLSIRGGTERFRYYVSGNYDDNEGIVFYNTDTRYRARSNVSLLLTENLTLDINGSYIDGNTRFADPVEGEGGIWRNLEVPRRSCPLSLVDAGPAQTLCDRAGGYYEQHPGDVKKIETTRQYSRFVGGLTAQHTYNDWLTQRAVFGIDKSWDRNQRLFPVDSVPVYRETADGTIDWERPTTTNLSFDYAATASFEPTPSLGLETSAGAQFFVRQLERFRAVGTDFASTFSTTINQTPVEKMEVEYDEIENKSLGVYVQEQVDWQDRIFVTGAIRLDDNSAFGSNFDAQVYPKVSGAWVVSEEEFWNFDFANSLRIRGAWGRAGRQPATFAATNLYGVIPTEGAGGGIIPVQPGNPEVGPEVSSEIELGFDMAVLDDRFSGEFTYFSQKTEDALLDRLLPTSEGFPGAVQQNLGRIDNWGWEALVTGDLYRGDDVSFRLSVNASYSDNEIKDLGGIPGDDNLRVGYPYPNMVTPYRITSAELDNSGSVTNAMCDSGVRTGSDSDADEVRGLVPGGESVPCADLGAQDLMVGPGFHPYTFAVNPTLSFFQNALQIHALAEGKYGGLNEWSNSPWIGLFSGTRTYWAQDNPRWEAGRIFVGPYRDLTTDEYYNGDFWKLREISLRYQLPESLIAGIGADRASVTLSGRELWTIWQAQETIASLDIQDPERGANTLANNASYYDMPPTSSVHATVRVSF